MAQQVFIVWEHLIHTTTVTSSLDRTGDQTVKKVDILKGVYASKEAADKSIDKSMEKAVEVASALSDGNIDVTVGKQRVPCTPAEIRPYFDKLDPHLTIRSVLRGEENLNDRFTVVAVQQSWYSIEIHNVVKEGDLS